MQIDVSAPGAAGARSSHTASTSSRALAGIGGEEPRGPPQPPRAQVHGGDDREAAAASAQRPEEVVLAVHAPPLAGGRHDVQRGHAVERQTERAAREPHAAAGREPADRHVRARAGRDREPAAREPAVELEVAQPGPDGGDVAVEPEAIEAADVEHDGVAARRGAVVRVAAGAHDQRHVVAACPAHDGLHVGGVAHAHDRRRPDRVEAPVEHKPRAVVAAVAGREHAPAHRGAQLAQLGGRNPCVGVEREGERDGARRGRLEQIAAGQLHGRTLFERRAATSPRAVVTVPAQTAAFRGGSGAPPASVATWRRYATRTRNALASRRRFRGSAAPIRALLDAAVDVAGGRARAVSARGCSGSGANCGI